MITWDNTIRTLDNYARKIQAIYVGKNVNDGYDPAAELQNITFEVRSAGGNFEIDFNMPDYWRYAEEGRGPGKMPPEGSLLKWMQWKQILPSPMTLSSGRTVLPTMKQLEFLIRRKIGEKGTVGSRNWQETEIEIKDQLVEAVTKAIEKDFSAWVRTLVKKPK